LWQSRNPRRDAMTKREIVRNKMMLGALTMGDLYEFFKIEGEFSIGKNWLPIYSVKRKNRFVEVRMDDIGDPDMKIPVDSVVKVQGDVVRVHLDSSNIESGYLIGSVVEIRIRLDEVPFPETTLA
jgi:hypothetical protein